MLVDTLEVFADESRAVLGALAAATAPR